MMAVEPQIAMLNSAQSVIRKARYSKALLLLCLAFVMVRLPFIFTVPMVEAPDEFAHYWVIRFIRDHLRLPNAPEVLAGGPSAVYGSLPQLGYIPHLAMVALTAEADLSLFERFGSLGMGLLLLYAAFHIGRLLFPRNTLLSLAVPALVVFHPQLAFVHSYANNDATSSALSALILLLAFKSVKEGFGLRRSAIIGVLMGWLALSKYSGLAIMPVVAMIMVSAAILHKMPWTKVVAAASLCAVGAVGVSMPWFVRNYMEFSGDVLGTQTMYKTWATTFHRELDYHVSIFRVVKELRWWRMMFFSFWGLFGYMTKYMWRPTYFVYLGFLISAACGGIVMAVHAFKARSAAIAADRVSVSKEQWQQRIMWSSLGLCVLVNISAMLWASTTNLGGPQGRYLFTSEIPVLALLVGGMNQLGPRIGRKMVAAFVLFNMIVCAGAWVMLYCMYGFHGHPL